MPSNTKPLDPEIRRKLQSNLFQTSHAAIADWDRFPWHPKKAGGGTDAWQTNSSQALAIDVFGTLKVAPERHAIFDRIAASLGCSTGGPWEVELEWLDPTNRLGEPRKTQVDAVARSPRALLFFECKFTETDGGICSQTNTNKRVNGPHLAQCDGHYREQVNPINGVRSRCALSGKKIRYWELIPELFSLDPEGTYSPCPFAGPWYQWMRNLALCRETASEYRLNAGFVVVYVEAPTLPFPKVLASDEWQRFAASVNRAAVQLTTLSYQKLLAGACECHGGVWKQLDAWVTGKVAEVARNYHEREGNTAAGKSRPSLLV